MHAAERSRDLENEGLPSKAGNLSFLLLLCMGPKRILVTYPFSCLPHVSGSHDVKS